MEKTYAKLIVIATLILTIALGSLSQHAYAPDPDPDDPFVYTEDLNDDTEDYFEYEGETVGIRAYSNSVPYNISVYRSPPGQSYGTPYSGPWTFVKNITVTTAGWYTSNKTDISSPAQTWWKLELWYQETTQLAKGLYFVIPEVPLGIIGTLLAFFAAASIKHKKIF